MKKEIFTKNKTEVLNPRIKDDPKKTRTPPSVPKECFDKLKIINSNEIQNKPQNDIYGTIMLGSWIICAIIMLVGIFGRKMYLLWGIVPVIAFIGFVFLGFSLWTHFRNKNQNQSESQQKLETEEPVK